MRHARWIIGLSSLATAVRAFGVSPLPHDALVAAQRPEATTGLTAFSLLTEPTTDRSVAADREVQPQSSIIIPSSYDGAAYIRRRLVDAARRGQVDECQTLIDYYLTEHYDDVDDAALSYYQCYNYVLDALAAINATTLAHGERAEEVLHLLEQIYAGEQLDSVVYNKVLKVWKNSASTTDTSLTAIARAEVILKQLVDAGRADTISYTSYIAILAAHGTRESAQRATDICHTMMQRQSEQSMDTNTSPLSTKPTRQTWNTVMYAWVKCGDPAQAEAILRRMETFTDVDMVPDIVSYSTVMDGWAKEVLSGTGGTTMDGTLDTIDPLERMEALYDSMVCQASHGAVRPQFWTYVTLIHAHAKRRDTASTLRAQELVYAMYQAYQDHGRHDLKPNTQLVTAVMDAWQKSCTTGAATKAEALLNWMIDVSDNVDDGDLAPNEYSFSSVIAAWARSRSLGKAAHARRVLDRMIALHESGRLAAAPNTVVYTAVINACAYCENDAMDKSVALRIAIATFKELETSSYGRPNHVTYSNLLTALRNLLPNSPKRNDAIQAVFQSATKNGCVDPTVVKRVRYLMSPDELNALCVRLYGRDVQLDRLPYEWTRNVGGARP